MPNVISGNSSNITTPLTRTVTGAVSAAGLIKLTTSVAHLFSTGDIVIVRDVGGVPAASGTWRITVVDSTHFTLNSSTFSGTYTSGGSVTDYSLTPAFDVIADGESLTAAALAVSFQALADRTQYNATSHLASSTKVLVAPWPMNLSYANNWALGDDGTGSAAGHLATHVAPVDTTPLLFDFTSSLLSHNGRRIKQVQPVIAVGQTHSGVPANLPSINVQRSQTLPGSAASPAGLTSLKAGGAFAFPTPGSGSAWYNSGVLQNWTFVTDQNNVIDTTSFRYLMTLVDENGANALPLNSYYGFIVTVD